MIIQIYIYMIEQPNIIMCFYVVAIVKYLAGEIAGWHY